MKLNDIVIEDLSSLKSTSTITLHCDSCQDPIERIVKEVRRSIKNGKRQAFCSNTCQGKMLKINKTKHCEYCKVDFEYNFPTQQYCSVSCGNFTRVHSEETKKKISKSLSLLPRRPKKEPTKRIYKKRHSTNVKVTKVKESVGEFSKLTVCKCKNCSFIGSYRKQTLYCKDCNHCYSENGRAKFVFTFNVYHYPDLFDLEFLKLHGWRKTKGKDLNINGVSRDHKVSVHDAILNNYNPHYIKHPLNCTLMIHSDNQSKGVSSSITYEELVRLVDEYESR